MSVALLDTNVLLALAWPNHQHHAEAHTWFGAYAKRGWATCAFTQLGFIRLSSNPAYTPSAVSPRDAAGLLQQWTKQTGHRFWASPAADSPVIYARALGHQQVNDAWLVEVARQNSGRLITLDSRLPIHALKDGLVEVIKT
jgi:toxin-antitoxin system PIN domain toxin